MLDSCPKSLRDIRTVGARNADSLNLARKVARVNLVLPRPARVHHHDDTSIVKVLEPPYFSSYSLRHSRNFSGFSLLATNFSPPPPSPHASVLGDTSPKRTGTPPSSHPTNLSRWNHHCWPEIEGIRAVFGQFLTDFSEARLGVSDGQILRSRYAFSSSRGALAAG
ncbi:hypothetical protein L3X38_036950 [Prunus dulcis]|uniref:Uncharacterized protein n=1 Tax=Prunus dulcis TaxID=3755 RepID=A0AAD4YQU2_PRUDU|nr:hypothetical protein L3X38_036950 [Prunus dulcis]